MIVSTRRYYLLKMQATRAYSTALASAWQSKHNDEPGTALDAEHPGYAKLVAAHYTALEDIRGATVSELVREAGLSRAVAQAAIDAAE